MGIWLRANGRLTVLPPPDEKLLLDFWRFNKETWPEAYMRIDERFPNPWFFDKNNSLACVGGKFAEPHIWFNWMKEHFFIPRGYELVGELDIIGEGDSDIFAEDVLDEYNAWIQKVLDLGIQERQLCESGVRI